MDRQDELAQAFETGLDELWAWAQDVVADLDPEGQPRTVLVWHGDGVDPTEDQELADEALGALRGPEYRGPHDPGPR